MLPHPAALASPSGSGAAHVAAGSGPPDPTVEREPESCRRGLPPGGGGALPPLPATSCGGAAAPIKAAKSFGTGVSFVRADVQRWWSTCGTDTSGGCGRLRVGLMGPVRAECSVSPLRPHSHPSSAAQARQFISARQFIRLTHCLLALLGRLGVRFERSGLASSCRRIS